MHSLTVPRSSGGQRLDLFLAGEVPGCSRRSAQRAIATAAVRINGRLASKGQLVAAGDVVTLPDELYVPAVLQANPHLVVPVLYEDSAVIALDKPAGMPSHALRGDETATVGNFLLARHPELVRVGKSDREPGIVHRLDTDTSGVLLVARTQEAYQALRRQFAAQRVKKEYLALVEGDVAAPGEVHAPIAHSAHNRRKMRVCSRRSAHGRPARTWFRPLERFGNRTLLAVQIATGVMHQIRVHLASIGHPIVGDRLYGTSPEPTPARHLLHACRLAFVHPQMGGRVAVSSPLPADFAAVLKQLRERQPASGG